MAYLLGAGRSGTTLMAAVLDNADERIHSVGELHQFREHLNGDKPCSCGEYLQNCPFWKNIVAQLPEDMEVQLEHGEKKEWHTNIPRLLFSKKPDLEYVRTQEILVGEIAKKVPSKVILDSSKYIGRYLLLRRSTQISIKGIYVVRDVRGVINSFSKQVQTPKTPFGTIVYYLLINFFGQLVCWMDKDVIKVKYEDFVEHPKQNLNRISGHLFGKDNNELTLPSELEMPHIIGGNRLKHNKQITISPDYKWKKNMGRGKQILYYIAAFPLMMLNRYRI